mmetsp:Transcript_1889/g.4281  ORF Transcript_1889/g.4281 Transcript_1889/m.4281 type:complete len:277 (+) Transcript_1889:3720-4550(+)
MCTSVSTPALSPGSSCFSSTIPNFSPLPTLEARHCSGCRPLRCLPRRPWNCSATKASSQRSLSPMTGLPASCLLTFAAATLAQPSTARPSFTLSTTLLKITRVAFFLTLATTWARTRQRTVSHRISSWTHTGPGASSTRHAVPCSPPISGAQCPSRTATSCCNSLPSPRCCAARRSLSRTATVFASCSAERCWPRWLTERTSRPSGCCSNGTSTSPTATRPSLSWHSSDASRCKRACTSSCMRRSISSVLPTTSSTSWSEARRTGLKSTAQRVRSE